MSYSGYERLNHTGAFQDGPARIQNLGSAAAASQGLQPDAVLHANINLTLRSLPALVRPPSRQEHRWVKGEVVRRKGRRAGKWTDHDRGSSLWCRNVAHRATAAVKYSTRDWRFPWKCITAAGSEPFQFSRVSRGMPNQSTERELSLLSTCISSCCQHPNVSLTYACQSQRQTCPHKLPLPRV